MCIWVIEMSSKNAALKIAGTLSAIAAILHIAVIVGGSDWYRFFGAGEQMAQMAANGEFYPPAITLFIAFILLIWSLYAFSAAGVIPRLPLVRTALVLISLIYLARGTGGLFLMLFPTNPQVVELGMSFMLWSSVVCLLYGVFYSIGTWAAWRELSNAHTQQGRPKQRTFGAGTLTPFAPLPAALHQFNINH